MRMIQLAAAAALTASCLAACTQEPAEPAASPTQDELTAGPTAPAPAQPTGESDTADSRSALMEHMHAHYTRLVEIRDAIATGDTARIEIAAYWLAQHAPLSNVPPAWEPYTVRMRAGAARLEEAVAQQSDANTLLAAADELEQACRGCHEANGVDVRLPPVQSPADPGALPE